MKATCEKYLNEQFGGDSDVVADIYAEYVSSSRTKISEAAAELAAGDWGELDRTAHTLKGNALAAGDGEIAQIGIELRQAALQQDDERCAALIKSLEKLQEEL